MVASECGSTLPQLLLCPRGRWPFGVVLLPIVALLKCGDMEGVVFFRGKVSLR